MMRRAPKKLPRVCETCLLYEGMPFLLEASTLGGRRVRAFEIGDDGVCSVCREYRSLTKGASHEDRRAAFDAVVPKSGAAVVAVSGGKDSLSTLYVVREQLGLEVDVLFYDSGFLLPHVAPQVRDVCQKLGVALHELRAPEEVRERITRRVERPLEPGLPACHECSRDFMSTFVTLAQERGAPAILGTNHFLDWPEDGAPRGVLERAGVQLVSLPYLLGITRKDTLRNVAELGATVVPSLAGLSTNCRVPELVQARVGAAIGHVPELEMLALEVVVDHIERSEAAAELVDRVRSGNLERTAWIVDAYGALSGSAS